MAWSVPHHPARCLAQTHQNKKVAVAKSGDSLKLGAEETLCFLILKYGAFEHGQRTGPISADQRPIYVQFVAYMSTIRLTADISLFDVLGWRLGYGGKRMLRSKSNYRAVR